MYCQSCGAANSDDAKFCNQCGGRIARPGDAGGPAAVPAKASGPGATAVGLGSPSAASAPSGIAPPSAPAAVNVWEQQQTSGSGGGPSMMSVSLDTIGVRSTKKVWAGIALVALLLVGLGALGSWLLRGEPEVIAEAGNAQPEDPFVIGTPLPPGELPTPVEPPVDDPTTGATTGSAMTSAMTGTTSGTSARTDSTMTATGTSTAMTGSTGTSGTMTGTTTGTAMTDTTTSMTGTTSMTDTTTDTSSMGTTEPSTDTSMDTSTDTSTGTMDGSTGGSTGGTVPNLGGDLPEERDLELELYGSRVRFVVQRYYAARAQTCFDRATRNNPNVSGTVVVNMTIGADGNVSDTSVARNTTGDEVLGNCLRSQVASWQLPPPPGGSLQMQMPFSR
jgi:TonB family protein